VPRASTGGAGALRGWLDDDQGRPANLLPPRSPATDDHDRARRRDDPDPINQLDVIVKGVADTLTWVKSGLNYCVPFIVSNLGLLAGKRAEADRDALR